MCNGKPTRKWSSREELASPKESTKGTFPTAMTDAHEECNVMANDAPSTFTQTLSALEPGQNCDEDHRSVGQHTNQNFT